MKPNDNNGRLPLEHRPFRILIIAGCGQGRPKALRHPECFDHAREPFEDDRDTYAPLVWHCRYPGIEVPDDLWTYAEWRRQAVQP